MVSSTKLLNLKWQCEKSLDENEYNLRKINGVTLTHADVETALLYVDTMMRFGDGWRNELMEPRCEVRELLQKYGLI